MSAITHDEAVSAFAHDTWLTTIEAAKYLKISKQWLDKKRSWGGGPPFSVLGSRVIYKRSNLDKYAESKSRISTSDKGEGSR